MSRELEEVCPDCGKKPSAGQNSCPRCNRIYAKHGMRKSRSRRREGDPTTPMLPRGVPEGGVLRDAALQRLFWVVTEPEMPAHLVIQAAKVIVGCFPPEAGKVGDVESYLASLRDEA